MRSRRSAARAFRPSMLLLLVAFATTACDDDSSLTAVAPTTPAIAPWAGTYSGQARFGAENGTWGNGGTFQLVVTSNGAVTVSGRELQAFVFEAATATLRWQRSDGNATNGEVTFHDTLTSDFFFRDQPNGTGGRGFTGWIQRAQEGRLDYRGLRVP